MYWHHHIHRENRITRCCCPFSFRQPLFFLVASSRCPSLTNSVFFFSTRLIGESGSSRGDLFFSAVFIVVVTTSEGSLVPFRHIHEWPRWPLRHITSSHNCVAAVQCCFLQLELQILRLLLCEAQHLAHPLKRLRYMPSTSHLDAKGMHFPSIVLAVDFELSIAGLLLGMTQCHVVFPRTR